MNLRTQPWPLGKPDSPLSAIASEWSKTQALSDLIDQILAEGKPADPAVWQQKKARVMGSTGK